MTKLGTPIGAGPKGAIVVADNADDSPEFLAYVRDPANGYLSVPFADDVEVSMRG